MDLETKLSIPPQVMSRLVGDETVLLDLASGVYFGLDGVGKRIWESVADGNSLGEAVDVIVAEYEVEETQAQADVIAFANQLIERGRVDVSLLGQQRLERPHPNIHRIELAEFLAVVIVPMATHRTERRS